jgi:hypothetical protein
MSDAQPRYRFTWKAIEAEYRALLSAGYEVITCADYVRRKHVSLPALTLVNRVDIDVSMKRAERLCQVFNGLGIKATFFVRLHGHEYNPFSFENYRILKFIVQSGHEVGYHSEIIDQSEIWQEDAADCLRRDIDVLNRMLGIRIEGVASHGGMTGSNNLDFWKQRTPAEFGLLYEGYDKLSSYNLFHESFYVSDSEWTRWKCYDKGKLVVDDRRSPAEHARDRHPLLHLLIHPDTYFDRHFYE